MNDYTLTIKSDEKKGVLDDITDVITEYGANISYVHLFIEKNNVGSINLELDHVDDIDELISALNDIEEIKSVELHGSQLDIYGKRIIIVGGGAQVSQVAMGAITEADRHNIRGERISIDTIPLVGEKPLAEAIEAISRLPRVSALVLAGSLMGGEITQAVKNVKEKSNLIYKNDNSNETKKLGYGEMKYPFIEYMSYRLKMEGKKTIAFLNILEQEVEKMGTTVSEIIKKEHFDIALKKVMIGNCITAIKRLSRINFLEIFESINGVEEILKQNPALIYSHIQQRERCLNSDYIVSFSFNSLIFFLVVTSFSLNL